MKDFRVLKPELHQHSQAALALIPCRATFFRRERMKEKKSGIRRPDKRNKLFCIVHFLTAVKRARQKEKTRSHTRTGTGPEKYYRLN